MASGRSLALQISSMISTSHASACAQNPRTARTGSTGALPPESAFSNIPSASALSARVQNTLERLKLDLRDQRRITDLREVSSTRNFAQNPRIARTASTRALPPESAFSNTPSASALSARVQNALKTLWSNFVASPPTTGPTLHSIGFRGGIVPTQFVCGLLVFALTRGKSTESVCLARRSEATARTDIRLHSCLK
jgi:hypothetical protein